MFKKLKDKIAEEVKSSPQRVQQLAKSVVGNNTTDDNMFSIDEETAVNSFNSSPLPSTYSRSRRDSNSSFASDVSFLPNYESPGNLYHLQSDLDVSASEVEDSSMGTGDTKQMLNAYRNVLAKYNKYRGRYSDLANHYRILERENAKTKAVLVETQDKALRRVAELKEQCQLEQTAKAHIEQVLREDLNERQILIDTLNQKIQLLQESNPSIDVGSIDQEDFVKIRIRNQELEQKILDIVNSQTSEIETVRQSMKQKLVDLEAQMKDKLDLKDNEIERLKAKESDLQQTINTLKSENTSVNCKVNDLTAEIKAIKMMSDEKCKKMEKHISALETDKNGLQLKLKDAFTLQEKIDDLVTELKATKVIQVQSEENVKSLENTLKTKENQLNDLMQELAILKTKYNSIEQESYEQTINNDEFVKVLDKLLDTVGIKTKENIFENKNILLMDVRSYVEHQETELIKINATCNKLNKKITELLETNSKNENDLMASIEEMEYLKRDLNEKQSTETSVKVEKETLNSEVQNLQKICEDQKTALNNSEVEQQKLIRKIESLQSLVHDSKTALTNITKEKVKLNNEIKQLRQSFENIESTLLNSVAEKEKLLREVSKYKKLYEEKENNFKTQLDEQKKLNDEIKQLQENDEVLKFKTIIEDIKTNLNSTTQERDQLIEEMKKLQKELENNDILVKNMTSEHNKMEQSFNEQQTELKLSKDEINNLNEQIKQLENLLGSITQERDNLTSENQNATIEINHLKQQHSDNQSEIKTILKCRDDLNTEISDLKLLLDNQQSQLLSLSEDKEILQLNLQEQNKKYEDLLNEKHDEKSDRNLLEGTINTLKLELHEKEVALENLFKKIEESDIEAKNKILIEADEEIKRLKQTFNEEQSERLMLQTKLDEKENLLINISEERQSLHKQNELFNELQSKYLEIKQQLQIKSDSLTQTEEIIENLNISLSNEKSILISLRNENKQLQESIEQLQSIVNEKDYKLKDVLNEMENNNKLLEIEEELEQKTNLLIKSEETIQEIKEQYVELKMKNDKLLKELEDNNQNITDNNNTIMKLKEFEDENNSLRGMCDDTVGKLKNLEIEFSRLIDERETNVQFYQNEILKLQNKNEKLESKLDETLVTLNHCTEISSSSTEMQYLRNILYNYMMGKESIVLARVIAAVCKFDPLQTDAVLQKEQQKQTMFGHFGL